MDLNELLHAHQVAVMNASAQNEDDDRDGHFAKVAEYAERVRQLRAMRSPPDVSATPGEPPAIIYGSYAGEDGDNAAPEPVGTWGDKGVVRKPPPEDDTPPADGGKGEGYRVGGSLFASLDEALAEHLRIMSAERDTPAA